MENGEIPENANEHCPGPHSKTAGKSDSCAGCPNQACATSPKGPDPGTASSIDVTQDIISCIRENASELLNVVACSKVFDSSGGGSERMCREMGVTFLGKVPLEPQLGRAAEQGKYPALRITSVLLALPLLRASSYIKLFPR